MMVGVNKNDHNDTELDLLLNIENDDELSEIQNTNNIAANSNKNDSRKTSILPSTSSTFLKYKRKYQEGGGGGPLVRNKRCDLPNNDNNFSVGGNFINLTKKKPLIVFIVLALLIIYLNSTVLSWTTTEKIPVLHHSTVPGMKELELNTTSPNRNHDDVARASNDLDNKYYNNKNNQISELSSIIVTSSASSDIVVGIYNQATNRSPSVLNATFSSLNSTTTTINTTITTTTTNNYYNINLNKSTILPLPSGYLVWSDKCKMPSIDPYDPEIIKFFTREKYQTCNTNEPLTNYQFNTTTNKYMINFNEKLKIKYGNTLDCCYHVIERNGKGKNADKYTSLSECLSFAKSTQIANTTYNILVKCKSQKKQVYINGYPLMPERPDIRDRLENWKKNDSSRQRPVSILMLGIDSISRVNLIRAMPKTAQLLYDTEWFEMSGYNKMDDNTFPNLMAILTGYNSTTAFTKCAPTKLRALDDCPMIWKTFRENGYVTAYAEDEASISTFNYLKLGFEQPPVDYYLRPFLIAAEKVLPVRKKSGLTFCLGYQHSADYVYDYALELATRYRNEPYFGLFWTNTFSHNDISDCSSMDVKMVDYVEKLSTRGVLNESVVIFFSDHGMRFGPTRKFLSGHLEERLPFMFIWLPPWLKEQYPEIVNAISVNKNRLTNPYDIHMTLKHLLELSGRVSNLPKAPDCPNCQSLLKPVPQSRSCEEIAIEDHWCTCIPYEIISIKSPLVNKIALYTVDYINNYVANFKNGSVSNVCGKLTLNEIVGAYRANFASNIYSGNVEGYRIVLKTTPGFGLFEATIRHRTDTDEFEVTGSISRLNTYASDSKCISDGGAKKYCHCLKHAKKSRAAGRVPAG